MGFAFWEPLSMTLSHGLGFSPDFFANLGLLVLLTLHQNNMHRKKWLITIILVDAHV